MIQCPQCRDVFDMLGSGQLVIGSDDKGLYMEHVPCGYRGRSPAGNFGISIRIDLKGAPDEG